MNHSFALAHHMASTLYYFKLIIVAPYRERLIFSFQKCLLCEIIEIIRNKNWNKNSKKRDQWINN
jgi:hypothetical protein